MSFIGEGGRPRGGEGFQRLVAKVMKDFQIFFSPSLRLFLIIQQSVVVVVVVEDFGSWVLPPSLNCSLAPCPSTLTRLALWAELFQQKIQSTVA